MVTFPIDLFYPVGVTTVGVFIKKGIPHPQDQNVLWIRALNDGFLKSKGRRLPNESTPDELAEVRDILKAFLQNPSHSVPTKYQFQQGASINFDDSSLELVPEVYLDQKPPTREEVVNHLEDSLREAFAYLVKVDRAVIRPNLMVDVETPNLKPHTWQEFRADHLFELERGHFHSLSALDEGDYPTISRVSTDNGFVGFYDMPDEAELLPPKTITVSTVAGDSFVQPVPFLATDNVVLCTPRDKYKDLSLKSLYFITQMINMAKWRYSYGRQCYKTKFATTEILLPVTESGSLDETFMEKMTASTKYWKLVQAAIEKAQESYESDE